MFPRCIIFDQNSSFFLFIKLVYSNYYLNKTNFSSKVKCIELIREWLQTKKKIQMYFEFIILEHSNSQSLFFS